MKHKLLIWYGELTTQAQLLKRGFFFLSSGMLWLMVFLVLPGLVLVVVSFATRGAYGQLEWTFTVENYKRLMGFSLFGWTSDYLLILWRSVVVALVTTLVSILLSYPLCFFIAAREERSRYMWLTLVIIPFWTNMVIRTYAWFLILAPELPFAKLAAALGFISEGAPLYPNAFAVYIGMVSMFLPFVTLPLYASVEKLDWSLVEAAQDLYASRIRVFTQAILPQTMPGLSVGVILTFVPAMGMFVVPDLLGGAKYMLVGNLIQQQFGSSRDWPFGAAISMGLMVLTMISLQIYRRRSKEIKHHMKRTHPIITSLALLTMGFLYIPLVGVAVFSVNSARRGLVWKGFTLDWYVKLFSNEWILEAAWNTLVLAVVSTLVATVLGTVLAIGMDRFPWTRRTSNVLDIILHIPVVIPDIILAAALVVAFGILRVLSAMFEPGLLNMIIGHITFQIAFVALVVRSRLIAIGHEIEEAARDLFASNWYLLRRIMLPLLMPGIVAGGMLAFTLSLDDFVISFFTAGPESQTLPLYIFAAVRRGVTPQIHALSTLIMIITVVLVIGTERISRKG